MKPVSKEEYKEILELVKESQPHFYEFLSAELSHYEEHHYYHTKIHDSFKNAIDIGFIPPEYKSTLDAINSIRKRFIYNELFGTWKGIENEKIQITLHLENPNTFRIERNWEETIDDEVMEENQEFFSFESVMIESDDLIILNLFYDERKRTALKLVLYPVMENKKFLSGSLYVFQNSMHYGCSRVFLEKVEHAEA